MLETFKSIDTQIFLFLNGLHTPFLDKIMWLASDTLFWVPLYLWFLWLLYRSQKKEFWLVILLIIAMIAVSDQLCNIFKFGVMRIRPSNDPSLKALVHLVKDYSGVPYSGGLYGFYSSHASNSFAFIIFINILIKKKYGYLFPVLLAYPLLTSYSRIYLGVHYPGDVLAGMIFGIAIGHGTGKLFLWLRSKIEKKKYASKNN
jgi:undecaprenyl-diphosphatase